MVYLLVIYTVKITRRMRVNDELQVARKDAVIGRDWIKMKEFVKTWVSYEPETTEYKAGIVDAWQFVTVIIIIIMITLAYYYY